MLKKQFASVIPVGEDEKRTYSMQRKTLKRKTYKHFILNICSFSCFYMLNISSDNNSSSVLQNALEPEKYFHSQL